MADYYKNNDAKIKILQEFWYKENGRPEDGFVSARTNLMTNEEVANSRPGTFEAYKRHISTKITPKVSNTDIILTPNEDSLVPIFWYNTSCLDTSNYQSSNLENLKNQISSIDKKEGKVVVFMTGDVIGKEWTFNHLLNSANEIIKKNDALSDEESVIKFFRRIYFGLEKRKERVINDIKAALRCGASKVYLMKGVEEFEIMKKLSGRDILQEIVNAVDDFRVVYIKEGTEAVINFIKVNKNNKRYYNTIRINSGYKTKSENPAQIENPSEIIYKDNSTVTFHCGGNFTASKNHTNEFYPSGQAMFLDATKGKNPQFRVTDGNIFKLLPVSSGEVQVVKGVNKWKDDNAELIEQNYIAQKINEALAQLAKEKIDDKIREIWKKPNHGKGGNSNGKSKEQ